MDISCADILRCCSSINNGGRRWRQCASRCSLSLDAKTVDGDEHKWLKFFDRWAMEPAEEKRGKAAVTTPKAEGNIFQQCSSKAHIFGIVNPCPEMAIAEGTVGDDNMQMELIQVLQPVAAAMLGSGVGNELTAPLQTTDDAEILQPMIPPEAELDAMRPLEALDTDIPRPATPEAEINPMSPLEEALRLTDFREICGRARKRAKKKYGVSKWYKNLKDEEEAREEKLRKKMQRTPELVQEEHKWLEFFNEWEATYANWQPRVQDEDELQEGDENAELNAARKEYRTMVRALFGPSEVVVLPETTAWGEYKESSQRLVWHIDQLWFQSTNKPRVSSDSMMKRLKECIRSKDLKAGRRVHSDIVENGLFGKIYLANTLVHMYATLGSMEEACEVHRNIKVRTSVTWNALMWGFLQQEDNLRTILLFDKMDCPRSSTSYNYALIACMHLAKQAETEDVKREWIERGEELHEHAKLYGFDKDQYVQITLLKMYSYFGDMAKARSLFDGLPRHGISAWTTLINGYVRNGDCEQALKLFDQLEDIGCPPSERTFVVALRACADSKWLDKGRDVYHHAQSRSCCDIYVQSAVVFMFAKCGSMVEAQRMFDYMEYHNVATWNSLLRGYLDCGDSELVLDLYNEMEAVEEEAVEKMDERRRPRTEFAPDAMTYVAGLTAIADLASKQFIFERRKRLLEQGKAMHSRVVIDGRCNDSVIEALVKMYTACKRKTHAATVKRRRSQLLRTCSSNFIAEE